MSQTCCKSCKHVREHVASLLPFKVLESAAGKPLRISGIAMAAGMSRNFNVYTPEELEAFAPKLVNAPVYIEHVSVANAAGKVTKCTFDSASRCLMYEAEIYDPVIADKIRNGLIQHVSVGADYDALDVVDAKIPHGLSKPELSLVAVPGIPETNIQVLERLRESFAHSNSSKLKLSVKEALGETEVFCVFCSNPADYFVSICQSCVKKFSVPAASQVLNALSGLKVVEAAGDLPSDFTAFKVRFVCHGANPCPDCKALNGKEFVYGTEPQVPIHDGCQCGYEVVERLHVHFVGVEKLEEKDLDKIVEKVALKVGEINSLKVERLKTELTEAQKRVTEAEGKVKAAEGALGESVGKLSVANKAVEDLRKQLPGGGLLKDPPVLMAVSEHITVLEGLLPPVMAERSSMFSQRQAQAIRAEIFKAKEKLK